MARSNLRANLRPTRRAYLLVLQLLESFLILVTLNICPAAAEPAAVCDPAEDPLEPEALPLTSTSLFTCALSLEVSPAS